MRKQIRDTIKEQLESIFDLQTVRIGRRHNYNADQLNAASIFTDSEESEVITLTPRRMEHTLTLAVEFYVKPGGIDLGEDTLDAIIDAADPLILAAVQALDGVFDIAVSSLEIEGEGEDADADYLLGTRNYEVLYHSAEPTG